MLKRITKYQIVCLPLALMALVTACDPNKTTYGNPDNRRPHFEEGDRPSGDGHAGQDLPKIDFTIVGSGSNNDPCSGFFVPSACFERDPSYNPNEHTTEIFGRSSETMKTDEDKRNSSPPAVTIEKADQNYQPNWLSGRQKDLSEKDRHEYDLDPDLNAKQKQVEDDIKAKQEIARQLQRDQVRKDLDGKIKDLNEHYPTSSFGSDADYKARIQALDESLNAAIDQHNRKVSNIFDSVELPDNKRTSPLVAGEPNFKTAPYTTEGRSVREAHIYRKAIAHKVQRYGNRENALGNSFIKVADKNIQQADEYFANHENEKAQTALKWAYLALDIAASLTPGVNVAKDVYEAVTGKNMITGEQLDTFGWSMAILGAVTLGVSSEAVGAFKVLHAAAEAGEVAVDVRKADKAFEVAEEAYKVGIRSEKEASEIVAATGISNVAKEQVLEEVVEGAEKIGINNAPQVKQLASTIQTSGVKSEQVTETLDAVGKSKSFSNAVRNTPSDKPMFYVKKTGEAIPSTGYRYVPSNASYIDELVATGRIPANPATATEPYRATYLGFEKFDDAATAAAKLQVPHDAAVRVEFDTLQIADEIEVPRGMYNTADYLEPITKDYPQYGMGGAAQAITNSEIKASRIVDLKDGRILYERK